ncbi:calcium/proton exchanger [Ginsengibacter hankyongi]|uniref:Ca(2+)/H(+) antiporter n=1 Tax=Ginsengibacter hankyongi TaxID=2607284 RepID=A0A5J5IB30_9BACT|nr:calcium/proton exchanger [Ginsengibacter hankyongi]KAA9035873.1 calcium/proton exchanger [Ginsengibacter hankyongi]
MKKREKIIIAVSIIVTAVAGILNYLQLNVILSFVVSAGALALLAKMVGDATEQLGSRFGPAATGILQSALGNLPEFFVAIFALKAGLNKVVQAALIGSILGNSLLVLGLAIFLGGLKNGTQRFSSEPPKMMATLMILALAGLAIPTVTHIFHTPGSTHINQMDIFLAIVLLIIFIASLFVSLKGDTALVSPPPESEAPHAVWPLAVTIIVLTVAGVAAGFVSDWFVNALKPAMQLLNINDTFAGLVIVAIAGNAIENVVGVQLAYKNQSDYAMSVIMNSSLQVALGLFPLLVLLSFFLGGSILSFVLAPMLLVSLALGVIVSAFIVFDGESIWLEGLALIGLYLLIAAAFWWG